MIPRICRPHAHYGRTPRCPSSARGCRTIFAAFWSVYSSGRFVITAFSHRRTSKRFHWSPPIDTTSIRPVLLVESRKATHRRPRTCPTHLTSVRSSPRPPRSEPPAGVVFRDLVTTCHRNHKQRPGARSPSRSCLQLSASAPPRAGAPASRAWVMMNSRARLLGVECRRDPSRTLAHQSRRYGTRLERSTSATGRCPGSSVRAERKQSPDRRSKVAERHPLARLRPARVEVPQPHQNHPPPTLSNPFAASYITTCPPSRIRSDLPRHCAPSNRQTPPNAIALSPRPRLHRPVAPQHRRRLLRITCSTLLSKSTPDRSDVQATGDPSTSEAHHTVRTSASFSARVCRRRSRQGRHSPLWRPPRCPMDETLVTAATYLSGRPFCACGRWKYRSKTLGNVRQSPLRRECLARRSRRAPLQPARSPCSRRTRTTHHRGRLQGVRSSRAPLSRRTTHARRGCPRRRGCLVIPATAAFTGGVLEEERPCYGPCFGAHVEENRLVSERPPRFDE